ncbi:MAG: hypothetical protein C0483_26120 [Pirellula sp.]|nr:hypothetical protein [Pirellula sp.]
MFELNSRHVFRDIAMTKSTDKAYKATKRIKQGKASIAAPFNELAAWISKRWDVTVLNIIYDRRNKLHAPRLHVILESHDDAKSFERSAYCYDKRKQIAVASRFLNLIGRQPSEYDVDGLFVVFSAFAPIALQEADSRVSDQEVGDLKQRIDNPDLWEISRCFGHVTFFFYTDAQARDYAASGKMAEYARRYFEILKPHDEFDYLSEDEFKVAFDSKQNFDENYQSSSFYYYR